MAKKIEDYLKYYLGQKVVLVDEDGKPKTILLTAYQYHSYRDYRNDMKPLLRKLSSMSEEEIKEYRLLMYGEVDMAKQIYRYSETPDSFHYLLSKGFDLFGLIDEGLAVDQNTITQTT